MDLRVLVKTTVSEEEFISTWSFQYQYTQEHLYEDNIGKELTEKRIFELFEWKNGSVLSKNKIISVKENYINEKSNIPETTKIKDFLNKPGGAIWRIFWLHCLTVKKFPIYDQHVHRAMATILGWENTEISNYNKYKINSYLEKYVPFHAKFSKFNERNVDKALWAYGKFLSSNYKFKSI